MSQGQRKGASQAVFGRELYFRLLDGYIPQEENAQPRYLAFRGPVGSGRHTLVKYLAARLSKKGWGWSRRNAALLTKEEAGALARELNGKKHLLLLEGLDALEETDALVDMIHDLGSRRENLYVVTVLKEEDRLPERLERRFLTVELGLPEVEDRREFLKGNLNEVLSPDLQNYLCRQTEGWNYLELRALTDHCWQLFQRNLLTSENVEKTLRQLLKLCHRELPRPIVWEERFEKVWKDLAEAVRTMPKAVAVQEAVPNYQREADPVKTASRPVSGSVNEADAFDVTLLFNLPSPEEQTKRIDEKIREAAEATNT